MSVRKVAMMGLLALWAGTVGILTLSPDGATPPLTLTTFLCIGCGWRHAADIFLNWALFLPAGALLATLVPPRRAVGLCLLVTLGIEVIQIGVPGRDPALQDLVFNTLGALSGAGLVLKGLSPRESRLLALGIAAFWLAPAALLVPLSSDAPLYGQWTPTFPGLERYEGTILEARVGSLRVPSRRYEPTEHLSLAVTRREPIDLLLIAGPPPTALSAIFQIYDERRMEILMIGALGDDLVVRGKNPARVLRMDQPDARWRGAFATVSEGDTIRLRLERAGASMCAEVGSHRKCGLAPGSGDSWGFLLHPEGAPHGVRFALGWIWALLLGSTLAAAVGPGRVSWAAAGLVASLGYLIALVSPDVRPDLAHAVLFAVGGLAGNTVRGAAQGVRRWASPAAEVSSGP